VTKKSRGTTVYKTKYLYEDAIEKRYLSRCETRHKAQIKRQAERVCEQFEAQQKRPANEVEKQAVTEQERKKAEIWKTCPQMSPEKKHLVDQTLTYRMTHRDFSQDNQHNHKFFFCYKITRQSLTSRDKLYRRLHKGDDESKEYWIDRLPKQYAKGIYRKADCPLKCGSIETRGHCLFESPKAEKLRSDIYMQVVVELLEHLHEEKESEAQARLLEGGNKNLIPIWWSCAMRDKSVQDILRTKADGKASPLYQYVRGSRSNTEKVKDYDIATEQAAWVPEWGSAGTWSVFASKWLKEFTIKDDT
jgi:hypothetical protein